MSLFKNGFACAQRDVWRIDKTAAITSNPVRIGDHDVRLLTGHFGIAFKLTGLPAADFIENQLRRLTIQLTVANNHTTQIGRCEFFNAVI